MEGPIGKALHTPPVSCLDSCMQKSYKTAAPSRGDEKENCSAQRIQSVQPQESWAPATPIFIDGIANAVLIEFRQRLAGNLFNGRVSLKHRHDVLAAGQNPRRPRVVLKG